MPKVDLPDSSAADSFFAEIEKRKLANKNKQALPSIAENLPESEDISPLSSVDDNTVTPKDGKKKSGSNRIVIPKPPKKERKGDAITFRLPNSLKIKFQKKCEEGGVSQNYILENLVEIWVKMGE